MSAIAGIYNINEQPINSEHAGLMMKALEKFPANDIQIWINNNVFLGCHAQWITPESIGEPLPYYDPARKLAITADAIIDNREELFERLQIENRRRKTITDSELILLAYHKWGEESPKFLVGDFAYMIWDEKKQSLFGARDFSGGRTLYYFHDHNRLAFCTTIKPLLDLPYIEKKLNEQWLAEFLAIPDMFDTADTSSTVYKGIRQIPPSHTMKVSRHGLTIVRYEVLKGEEKLSLKFNQEYEEAFQEIFQTAVKARLRSHHQIGAQLSGGLDSGAVASFAAKALLKENKPLHTYSFIPEADFVDWTPKHRLADEREYIHSTVNFVGNIQDHYLSFPDQSAFSEIDDWLNIMEMPYKFFENSVWIKGTYDYAQKQKIGILLNGARGNFTISWGSALEYYASLIKKFKWWSLYKESVLYSRNLGIGRKKVLSVAGKKAFPIIDHFFPLKETYQFPVLINKEFARKTDVYHNIHKYGYNLSNDHKTNLQELRRNHFEQGFWWNTTNTSASKLSLKYSIWNRDPTNDLRVIRFCLSVPENQYVQAGVDRALIRRSTKNYLPDQVRLNQRFRGVQGADWIHRIVPKWKLFVSELQQMSNDPIISGIFNMEVLNSAISKVQLKPQADHAFDPDYRMLMRSLIVYRFIKRTLERR